MLAKAEVDALESPKIKRQVKHMFTREERETMNVDLLNALGSKDAAESDFENVKATYKAKIAQAEAIVNTLVSNLRAGFELRPKECVADFRTKDRKKDIYVCETGELIATEDMTADDYQQDLFQAESKFENREEITLWNATGLQGNDVGTLVVGRLKGKWYSALRLKVGQHRLDERLDSEQKCAKARWDIIYPTGKRCIDWLKANLHEAAKSFEQPIWKVLDQHQERVE